MGGTITGDVVITGDLTVSGSTVQLSAEVVNVKDNTILLNKSTTSVTSNCSGLAVYRGAYLDDAEFTFNNSTSSWTLSNYVQLDKILDSTGSTGATGQALSRSSDGTTKWATVAADTTALESRVNTISSGVSANLASITTLTTRVDTVSSAASANESALTAVNSRVDTVSSVASANESAIVAVNSRVDTVSSRVTTVCSATVNVIARVNAIEATASDNEVAIVAANTRIDTVSSAVSANEAAILSVSAAASANEVAIQTKETIVLRCKNVDSVTLGKGTPVYVESSVSSIIGVKAADASDHSKMPAIGLLEQGLLPNAHGNVIIAGLLRDFYTDNIDYSQFSSQTSGPNGLPGWVGDGGGITITRPDVEFRQNVGTLIKGTPNSASGIFLVNAGMQIDQIPYLDEGEFFYGDVVNGGTNRTVTFSSELASRMAEESISAHFSSLEINNDLIVDTNILTVTTPTGGVVRGVGIKTDDPANDLHVNGGMQAGYSGSHPVFVVNPGTNRIGVRTSTPAETVDIVGDLQVSGGMQLGLNNSATARSLAVGNNTSTGGFDSIAVGQDLEINGIRNHAFGYGITIGNTQAYNFVVGNQHTLGSINQGNLVAGEQNELQGAKFNLILGAHNYIDSVTVLARTSENNILSGNTNKVDSALYSVVAGKSNSSVVTNNMVMMGLENTASSVNNSVLAGNLNSLQSCCNTLAVGKSNTGVSSNQTAFLGQLNSGTAADYSIIGGYNNTASTVNNSFIAGAGNTVETCCNSLTAGKSNSTLFSNQTALLGESNTTGNANYSVVGGYQNTASSVNNTLIAGAGNTVRSSSNAVVAGKANTAATANQSTVLGELNNVTANWSVVGGYNNSVSANNSVVMGQENNVQGGFHTISGYNNTATNNFSLVAGTNNTSERDSSIVAGDGNTAAGKHCLAMGFQVTVGTANDWFSTALGYRSIATGTASFAGGIEHSNTTKASALGKAAFTYGEGTRVFANANNSQAFGALTEVGHSSPSGDETANQATAMGYNTKAKHDNSIAAGNTSDTEGETSFAFGQGCKTHPNAPYSFVHGFQCQTGESPNANNFEAKHSTAIGYYCRAYKNNSFAGGSQTNAYGDTSFAFGNGANASAGLSNIALGEGITTATDSSSADSDGQTAVGRFNSYNYTGTVPQMFAVGTGTADGARYTSFYVGPRSSSNANIVMQALYDSATYTSDTLAGNGGVPLGGLYRDGNTVKIRMTN